MVATVVVCPARDDLNGTAVQKRRCLGLCRAGYVARVAQTCRSSACLRPSGAKEAHTSRQQASGRMRHPRILV